MFRLNWYRWSFLTVLIGPFIGPFIGLVGCSSGTALTPATGVVTLAGKPVEGATVTFTPAGENGQLAIGKTDASGNFELNTPGQGPGAMEGSYKVTIVKSVETKPTAGVDPRDTGGEPMTQAQMAEAIKQINQTKAGAKGNYTSMIPTKYGSPASSEMKADVTKGGNNSFVFEMTKK